MIAREKPWEDFTSYVAGIESIKYTVSKERGRASPLEVLAFKVLPEILVTPAVSRVPQDGGGHDRQAYTTDHLSTESPLLLLPPSRHAFHAENNLQYLFYSIGPYSIIPASKARRRL